MAYSFRNHTTRKDYAMFKFNCPSCHGEIEAEDEMAGQLADCPYCNKTIEVRRQAGRLRKAVQPTQTQQANATMVPSLGILVKDWCFWVGFFLFIPGLVVAGLVRGGKGAMTALFGLCYCVLSLIILYFCVPFIVSLSI